jgi:uncharacterized protein
VNVEDKTLYFQPVSNNGSDVLTLTMNDDLLEFYPRLSSLAQISQVQVRGWNPKNKTEIQGRAQKGDQVSNMGGQKTGTSSSQSVFGDAVSLVSDLPITTQAEADQLAKAQFNRLSLQYVVGEGICWGRTDLKPGKLIKIDGIGQRFSGQYYVTAVSHRYSSHHAYETHFEVRRNAT